MDVAAITGVLTTTAATVFNGGFAANAVSTITTADNAAQLSLISTDTDASSGPRFDMYRNPGEAGADSDNIGQVNFFGLNDASEKTQFVYLATEINDAANGSEDSRFTIGALVAGADSSIIEYTQGTPATGADPEIVFNNTSRDINFRVESDNATHALFVQGSDGKVGIGETAPNSAIHVVGTKLTNGFPSGILNIQDDNAISTAGNGGGLNFVGKFTSAGVITTSGSIETLKDNTNTGEYGFNMNISTRTNGGDNRPAIKITSEGIVTKPLQPSFRAGRSSNYTPNAGAAILFDDTGSNAQHFNIGGHYNTSNGRFTIPVDGRYYIKAQIIFGPSLTDGQQMDDAFGIFKNGVRQAYSARRAEYVAGTTGNSGFFVDNADVIVSGSANQFIEIRPIRTLPVHGNINYTHFMGYLIG